MATRIELKSRPTKRGITSGTVSSTGTAVLDGTGDYLETPSTSTLAFTSDFCLVAKVEPDDWTPAADETIIAKWNETDDLRSYQLVIDTTGVLNFDVSADGTSTLVSVASSAATGVTDGVAQWVAVTVDVDDGASDSAVKFWLGGSGATPSWSQLGTTQAGGAVLVIDSNDTPVTLGADSEGNEPLTGSVHYWAMYSGIGANSAPAQGTLAFEMNGIDFTQLSANAAKDGEGVEVATGQGVIVRGNPTYTAGTVTYTDGGPGKETYIRLDKRSFPTYGGLPIPTVIDATET